MQVFLTLAVLASFWVQSGVALQRNNLVNLIPDTCTVDENSTCTNALNWEDKSDQGWTAEDGHFYFHDYKRFSQSHIWDLLLSFYDRSGIESWSESIVPSYITSNTFIAETYVDLVLGFLEDGMMETAEMPLDPTEPIYIIELGTGAGMFSSYFMKALMQKKDLLAFPLENIKYVMTDFTENNLKHWESHDSFEEHIKSGLLDFAVFNAIEDESLTLINSKVTPGSLKNPVIIVANYLFDSLTHDYFQVDKKLKEGLVRVGSSRSTESDILDPSILERLQNKYFYREINAENYYSKDQDKGYNLWNRVLKWYETYFKDSENGGSFLLPIGAFKAMNHLSSFSSKRALILTADKAFDTASSYVGQTDPDIAFHGSVSCMLNMHAMGLLVGELGGFALHDGVERNANIKTSAFILMGSTSSEDSFADIKSDEDLSSLFDKRAQKFPFFSSTFEATVRSFSPEDFYAMAVSTMRAERKTFFGVLSLLKLSKWDPITFYEFRNYLDTSFEEQEHFVQNKLIEALPSIWSNHFLLTKVNDVPFVMGVLYAKFGQFGKAIEFYHHSMEHFYQTQYKLATMALAYYHLGTIPESTLSKQDKLESLVKAIQFLDFSIEKDPEYSFATDYKKIVEADLEILRKEA